jgi:hypothetical protein
MNGYITLENIVFPSLTCKTTLYFPAYFNTFLSYLGARPAFRDNLQVITNFFKKNEDMRNLMAYKLSLLAHIYFGHDLIYYISNYKDFYRVMQSVLKG